MRVVGVVGVVWEGKLLSDEWNSVSVTFVSGVSEEELRSDRTVPELTGDRRTPRVRDGPTFRGHSVG